MDLANSIRMALAASHSAIEATPLSRALTQGSITHGTYVELLGQLWLIHRELEERLAHSAYANTVYQPTMARTTCLENDLMALGASLAVMPLPATASLLETITTAESAALLGMLYVFEGSRMGSMYLTKPIAQSLGVAVELGQGIDYHMVGMATRPMMWKQFRDTVNALPLTTAEQELVRHTACQTMAMLLGLYTTLGTAEMVATGA